MTKKERLKQRKLRELQDAQFLLKANKLKPNFGSKYKPTIVKQENKSYTVTVHPVVEERMRKFRSIPSLKSFGGDTAKKESHKYTGTLIRGIATMHKSNAVPVLNEQEATEISQMRRN